MTVYIDRVFVLNLCVDYLLLLSTARLSGVALRRIRFLLCGAGGALYAVAVFLPGCRWLSGPIWKAAVGGLLSFFAFRKERYTWRLVGLFALLAGALAGVVLAVGYCIGAPDLLVGKIYRAEINWKLLLGGTIGLSAVLHLLFRQGARHLGGEIMTIMISVNGRTQEISALHDTGNTLRNPMNGQPVLVVEQAALLDMLQESDADILRSKASPEDAIAKLYENHTAVHFSLLPYRSVGTESGLLLAIRSDFIVLKCRKYPNILLALSPGCVSDGGGYCALWGGTEGGNCHAFTETTAAKVSADIQAG